LKKIIVLDVEGMSGKRPYDIGFIVCDKHGNIYETFSLACMPCIWENLSTTFVTSQEKAKVMTHRNIREILETPTKYQWLTVDEVLRNLNNAIVRHNISEIWAYNCTFDKGMITALIGDKTSEYPNICQIKWCDIWSAIIMTKCLTRKFVRYCREHGFVTDKGNIQTSAEVVYGYLTKNNSFEEEHTGLSDCRIELDILARAVKTKKKIIPDIRQPWKLVKNFVEEQGL
jgi:hypothetical protein